MKTYEETLPEGYTEAKVTDAADKKFGVQMNAAALVIMITSGVASYFIIRPRDFFHNFDGIVIMVLLAVSLSYMVLHELVHGAVYKVLTRRKLTFGIIPSAAYCGVPDIYVYRSCALASLSGPLIVFIIVFGGAVFLFDNEWYKFYSAVMLGVHLGGCAGDIYGIILLLFRFRARSTLMRDTGPKQIFYVKK